MCGWTRRESRGEVSPESEVTHVPGRQPRNSEGMINYPRTFPTGLVGGLIRVNIAKPLTSRSVGLTRP